MTAGDPIDLVVEDPDTLEHLLDRVPDGKEMPQFEATYDTKLTTGRRVRCRACKKKAHNHSKGFVLRYGDGSRILVGGDCGRRRFGQKDWVMGERALLQRIELAQYLGRKKATLRAAPAFRDWLERLTSEPALTQYVNLRDYLRTNMRELLGLLSHELSATQGRELRYPARVRDRTAEDAELNAHEERRQRAERDGRTAPPPMKRPTIYKTEMRHLGVLSGAEFFMESVPRPYVEIEKAVKRLIPALGELEGLTTTNQLKAFYKSLNDYLVEIEIQLGRVSTLPTSLSLQNFALIARWSERLAEPLKTGRIEFNGAQLMLRGTDAVGADAALSAVQDFNPPDLQPLIEFRAAASPAPRVRQAA